MRGERFLKQIAVNRLGRGGALAGRDNHLAIRGRDATGGVKAQHAGPHALVHFDLAVGVEFRAQLFRELIVENVAAGGEKVIDLHCLFPGEFERADLPLPMLDVADRFSRHGNFVFLQPAGVAFIPARPVSVRGHDHAGGIMEHA